jgi:hypothetical protein
MTNDDRIAALALATEPQKRDPESRINIGGLAIRKSNGREAYGKDVGDFLWSRNGTFCWDPRDERSGLGVFDNIYQALAAEIWAAGGSIRDRIQVSAEREADARSGVASLSKWLNDEWGVPLYRCKAGGFGNLVGIITVHPHLVINEATGETAAQAQAAADRDALKGQARAAVRRVSRDGGEAAVAELRQEVVAAIEAPVPEPRRKRLTAE